ncbi:MAG: 50S ribosomal protein L3 [Candidatus Nitrosotenuis sp.]|uniref:50S ribosomal protein L3 n=1 Tax=Candidatus Nitrosotenuis uzonensis TaxID=1407055 RepID=A0A812EYH9_9ARCH|nr:50S ribosomal protein L3 [Candidatus Nitrosotenuis uzonensis]CAE6499927.1 50S ribosomal protein L3 [Candidatus Nitrosotenuis uzonensis]
MGHRKHSQPRRGSLAYLPRGRAKSMEARIRTWPEISSEQPKLLGYAGFKVGCIQIVSIDDREKTPNHGKQLVSLGTVVATPPISVIGMRGYYDDVYGSHALFDVYSTDLPKEVSRLFTLKQKDGAVEKAEKLLSRVDELHAIVAVMPNQAGIAQKKPYVFEVAVKGGDIKQQFDFVKGLFGKQVKIEDVFELGSSVDVASITKGKGWEGPITRWGVKRKQHKSRKSVRAVGSLGPISPASIMYTVPRAGQRGFHQRVEYNKRIMIMSNTEKNEFKINPDGGFKHYGFVNGDFVVLKGSIPGTYRRMVKLRTQIRNVPSKILKPNILEVVI